MPLNGPPAAEESVWLDELSQSYAQGCGHLRLMLNMSSTYGLSDPIVPREVIKSLFQEFWTATPADKAKFSIVTKLGPLVGKSNCYCHQ
jgi:hypothetical protein